MKEEKNKEKKKEYINPSLFKKVIGVIGMISIIVILIAINFSTTSFTSCLNEKGAVLYTAEDCSHCADLKEKIANLSDGSSMEDLEYYDCTDDTYSHICLAKDIHGVPSWIINDTLYPNPSLEELASITGCKLEVNQNEM